MHLIHPKGSDSDGDNFVRWRQSGAKQDCRIVSIIIRISSAAIAMDTNSVSAIALFVILVCQCVMRHVLSMRVDDACVTCDHAMQCVYATYVHMRCIRMCLIVCCGRVVDARVTCNCATGHAHLHVCIAVILVAMCHLPAP